LIKDHDSYVAKELIFMLSRHQLADELYRERLAQARSRPQPPLKDAPASARGGLSGMCGSSLLRAAR
jgi:hypothetical protein